MNSFIIYFYYNINFEFKNIYFKLRQFFYNDFKLIIVLYEYLIFLIIEKNFIVIVLN